MVLLGAYTIAGDQSLGTQSLGTALVLGYPFRVIALRLAGVEQGILFFVFESGLARFWSLRFG